MKKVVIILALSFLLSTVSAIPTLEFQNEDIRVGETMLATIYTGGEFSGDKLSKEDIGFYEGRKEKYFEYDMIFYDNVYYIYAYARNPGNYSIKSDEILYKEGDVYKSVSIDEPFTIREELIDPETNETFAQALEIKPGFLYTEEDESVKITNKGTVDLNVDYGSGSVLLLPSQTEEIFPDMTSNFSFIEINSYKNFIVPVINPSVKSQFFSPIIISTLESDKEVVNLELYVDDEALDYVTLYNPGEEDMTDFEIGVDIDSVTTSDISSIGPGKEKNISIIATASEAGSFHGTINITYFISGEKELFEIPINLFILLEETNESSFEILDSSCKNLGGQVCEYGYICNGSARFTDDGKYCCFDVCVEKEDSEDNDKGSGAGVIIAIVIIAAIGGVGFYFYKKQKKTADPKKQEDPIKKSAQKYEDRVAVKKPEANRVKGNLQKS